MAPVSKPKKPLKSMEKHADKPLVKNNKKKKNFNSFAMYIYLVLRSIDKADDIGISRQAMAIMNSFVLDHLEKIAVEASRLVAHSKRTTLTSREVVTAIRLLIPGELGRHCHAEGMKALTMYNASKD